MTESEIGTLKEYFNLQFSTLSNKIDNMEKNVESKLLLSIGPVSEEVKKLRGDVIELYSRLSNLKDRLYETKEGLRKEISELEKSQAVDDDGRARVQQSKTDKIAKWGVMIVGILWVFDKVVQLLGG